MTIERVIEEMNKLAVADGLGEITIPICANARLKTTLGRVTFYRDVCIPIKIEFAEKLLKYSPDEDIIQVIKHEYAHYYLLTETGIDHKHDSVFRAKCAEIGCTHDGPKNHVESTAKTKYEVWCEDCDVCIGTYSRRFNTLKTTNIVTLAEYYQTAVTAMKDIYEFYQSEGDDSNEEK